jgi:hypothetical protein
MPHEQHNQPPPMAIPVDEEPERRSRMAGLRAVWNPAWAQARQNLRVWIPWLATRRDAACRVCVPSRDHRTGLNWEVALPRQCWFCATTERLEARTFDRDVRCFEHPLQIVGVALAISAFCLLLTCIWWVMAIVAWVALIGGAVVVLLKSWHEQVQVTLWACPDHRATLRRPEMVVFDDDLTLILGSESLTAAMRAQLKALRKVGPRDATEGATSRSSDSSAPSTQYAPSTPPLQPRAELPKIKLAGDEEE